MYVTKYTLHSGYQLTTLSVHIFQVLSTLYLMPPLFLINGRSRVHSLLSSQLLQLGVEGIPFTVHSFSKRDPVHWLWTFHTLSQTLLDARALLLGQKVAWPPWQGASNSCRLRRCRGWSKAKCLEASVRSCDSEHDIDHTLLVLSSKAGQSLSFLIDNHIPRPGPFREAQMWVGGEVKFKRPSLPGSSPENDTLSSQEIQSFYLQPQVMIRKEILHQTLDSAPPIPHTQERKLILVIQQRGGTRPKSDVSQSSTVLWYDHLTLFSGSLEVLCKCSS